MKDENLLIIGTPHMNEFVYKLLAVHIGVSVNEKIAQMGYPEKQSFLGQRSSSSKAFAAFCTKKQQALKTCCDVVSYRRFYA